MIAYAEKIWNGKISEMLPFLRQVTWLPAPDDDNLARIRHDPSAGLLLIPHPDGTQAAQVGDTIVIENDILRVQKRDNV